MKPNRIEPDFTGILHCHASPLRETERLASKLASTSVHVPVKHYYLIVV
jgi:hypothetical protein